VVKAKVDFDDPDLDELDPVSLSDLHLHVGLPPPDRPSTMVRPLVNVDSYRDFIARWSPGPRTPCEAAFKIPYYRELLDYLVHLRPPLIGYDLHLQTPFPVGDHHVLVCAVFQIKLKIHVGHKVVVVVDPFTHAIFAGTEYAEEVSHEIKHERRPNGKPQRV
jgi:hypothetical protein